MEDIFADFKGVRYDDWEDDTMRERIDTEAQNYLDKNIATTEYQGEEALVFHVGEGTVPDVMLDAVDYSDSHNAAVIGNVTAASIDRAADVALNSTDAEVYVLHDLDAEEAVQKEPIENEAFLETDVGPLQVLGDIADHYEPVEAQRRANQYKDELITALDTAPQDVREAVSEAYSQAFESFEKYEAEDNDYSEVLAQRDMLETLQEQDVDLETVNEALQEVETQTKPVFSRSMKHGYSLQERNDRSSVFNQR